jgi:hypothetical protein
MTCPTKRQSSDNWYFRRRILADVQAILAKRPKTQRPRNWYAKHISISLKTETQRLTLRIARRPAISSPGGLRTPAHGMRAAVIMGRHPKTFTTSDINLK